MLAEARKIEVPEAVRIYVSRSRDGDGYEVDSRSRRWLREQFPDVLVVPQLYLAHNASRETEPQLRDIWAQIVMLLVGVPAERLVDRGIKRISFLDPATNAEMEGHSLGGRP